jgi:hypothetical protein
MGDQIVVRVDASIVECHSRKQGVAGTYKKTFGHMPVGAWIDNTVRHEALRNRVEVRDLHLLAVAAAG